MKEVRGIRRVKVALDDAQSTSDERHHAVYYVINLAELTRGSMLGEQFEEWIDESKGIARRHDSWTWETLARWLLCIDRSAPSPNLTEIETIRQLFIDDPANAANVPYLENPAWVPSFVPSASDDPDAEPIASSEPMILMIREDALARSGFQPWYRRRVLFGVATRFSGVESTYFDDFRKQYLAPLLKHNRRIEAGILKPIAKMLAQLQVGEVLLTAVLDFVRPVAERRQLWRRDGVADPRAEYTYAVPSPSAARQSEVRGVRQRWSKLSHELIGIAQWQARHSKAAQARDAAAKTLLTQMRTDGEPLLQMLLEPQLVTPDEHLRLRALLQECFSALTSSTWACEELMSAEFAALAHAASMRPVPVPFDPQTPREKSLAAAIQGFDSRTVIPIEKSTTLGAAILDFFKERKEDMSTWKERASNIGIALDLLGIATPLIHRALFVPGTGVLDVAWAWRAAIGTAHIEAGNARWVWAELARVIRGKSAPGVATEPLLTVDRGELAKALDGLSSNIAWKTTKLLVTSVIVAEASAELSDETPEAAMKGLSTMLSAMKAGSDVISFDPQKCFLLARFAATSETAAEVIATLEKTPAIELLGPYGDLVTLLGSTLDFHGVSRKQSWLTREQKTEQLILDSLTLAVSTIGFVVGSELALASFVLYLAQSVLFNRDIWALGLPGITRAPAPQKYLSKILHTIDDDELIAKLREEGDLPPTKGGMSMNEFDEKLRGLLSGLDTPTADDAVLRTFWDVGGAPGASIAYTNFMATDILRDYYGFDEEAAADIVRKSNEVAP